MGNTGTAFLLSGVRKGMLHTCSRISGSVSRLQSTTMWLAPDDLIDLSIPFMFSPGMRYTEMSNMLRCEACNTPCSLFRPVGGKMTPKWAGNYKNLNQEKKNKQTNKQTNSHSNLHIYSNSNLHIIYTYSIWKWLTTMKLLLENDLKWRKNTTWQK